MTTASRLLPATAILLAVTAPAIAEGRRPCADRAQVVERLESRFGETLKSVGLNQRNVVEVYASEETGSWTILVTMPNGKSCLLASGELWEQDAQPLAKPGNDA
jgi:hypothetical protein